MRLHKQPTEVQALTIIYTDHDTHGWGWHVQWTKGGETHQEFHATFEAVSRLVESRILA